jgi:hypothetical protein
MTGPIRPSLEYVIDSITNIKSIFKNAKTHILYWDTTDADKEVLIEHFDNVYPSKSEPRQSDIFKNITARTRQQISLKTLEHWTPRIYKMFFGIRTLVNIINIDDNDIVMRIRTDLSVKQLKEFNINIQPNTYYFCPRRNGGNACDWFGISDYATFKKIWYYKDDSMYNSSISKSWNAEMIVTDNARANNINIVDIKPYFNIRICKEYINKVPSFTEHI